MAVKAADAGVVVASDADFAGTTALVDYVAAAVAFHKPALVDDSHRLMEYC